MGHSLSLSTTHLRGDGFGLTAAIFYAGYLLAVSRLRASLSTAQIMVWTSAIGALSLLPWSFSTISHSCRGHCRAGSILLALGVLSHAGGQSLIAYALAHLQVGFSGVALLMQPVAAAIFAWALLGEALGPIEVLGGLIVLAGVLVARRANGQRAGQLGMPKAR